MKIIGPHDTYGLQYRYCFCHLFFMFWSSNLFYFTLLLRKGIIWCFLQKSFVKNSRAELFDCGVANDLLIFTHGCVHGVGTMFCFAISVCFSFKETGVAFLQENLLYTSICVSIFFLKSMFAFISLFVNFVCYLTFWHPGLAPQDLNIDSHT